MTDEVLRCLTAVREFHADPANWCNTGDRGTGEARCIIWAITHIAVKLHIMERIGDVRNAFRAVLPPGVHEIEFNERLGTTHPELLAMYDRAIAARRTELVAA